MKQSDTGDARKLKMKEDIRAKKKALREKDREYQSELKRIKEAVNKRPLLMDSMTNKNMARSGPRV